MPAIRADESRKELLLLSNGEARTKRSTATTPEYAERPSALRRLADAALERGDILGKDDFR